MRDATYAFVGTMLLVIGFKVEDLARQATVPATPIQRAVKVARDSILCSSSASARQRRACARLDSIIVTPIALPPAADQGCPSSRGNICFASRTLYNAPVTADSGVTVCARLERHDGRAFVGYPAIRVRALGDSASFTPRFGSGNTIAAVCGQVFTRNGVTLPADSLLVTWSGFWLPSPGTPRGVWRPNAAVAQP